MKTVRLRELLLLLLSAALLVVVTECLPRQSDPYYQDDINDMALDELRDLLEERELEMLRAEAALPERARRYKQNRSRLPVWAKHRRVCGRQRCGTGHLYDFVLSAINQEALPRHRQMCPTSKTPCKQMFGNRRIKKCDCPPGFFCDMTTYGNTPCQKL
ncbi:uncharacterized protein [Branchiostoma lanceolatum]|uniref:uncharacterized protein isoform X1 n=1 Tax=Branchiostoma lanceolatum TaxID=7740 RepID=UPI003452DC23